MRKAARTVKPNARTGERHTWKDRERRRKEERISEEYRKYSGHEVKKFRAVPEITHRRWKELGLLKPLEPDQTAQYKFSDLQMSLYYTIYI